MKTHLNLLPWRVRSRLVMRSCLRLWSVVWGLSLVAVLGLWYFKYLDLQSELRSVAARNLQAKPLRSMQWRTEQWRQSLDELTERVELLETLQGRQNPLSVLGVVSRSAAEVAQDHGGVQTQRFSLEEQTKASIFRSETDQAATVLRLRLEGIAVNYIAVYHFINGLREGDHFARVELKKSDNKESPMAGQTVRHYHIECTL